VAGLVIAAIGHEGLPLAAGDQPVGQGEGFQPDLLAWPFVVEGKTRLAGADLGQPALMGDPTRNPRRGTGRRREVGAIGRRARMQGEQRQDIHEQQLLMLLLMVQAQLQQRGRLGEDRGSGIGEEASQGVIDPRAPVQHRLHGGPGDQAAIGPRLPLAHRLIIAVEQEARPLRRFRCETGRPQDEFVEEPGGVGQVPFAGAGVGHGLGLQVLGRQRRRQLARPRPDPRQGQAQGFAVARVECHPAPPTREFINSLPTAPKPA
jgi:hypothetical protein